MAIFHEVLDRDGMKPICHDTEAARLTKKELFRLVASSFHELAFPLVRNVLRSIKEGRLTYPVAYYTFECSPLGGPPITSYSSQKIDLRNMLKVMPKSIQHLNMTKTMDASNGAEGQFPKKHQDVKEGIMQYFVFGFISAGSWSMFGDLLLYLVPEPEEKKQN